MFENEEITLKSGNTLTIQHADFKTKNRLFKEFTRIAVKNGLDLQTVSSIPLMLDTGVKLILETMESDSMENLFWECAKVCLWNGVKIQQSLFDLEAEKIVPDFLEIKYYIINRNLSVFFSSHLSESSNSPILQELLPKIFKSLVSK